MKRRKLKRSKEKIAEKIRGNQIKEDNFFTMKVSSAQQNALNGIPEIKKVGNFILFSTYSGEAWVLDPRENLALWIADKYKPLPYTIRESKNSLHIEWQESFLIEKDVFIGITDGNQSSFMDYPIAQLKKLIGEIISE